MAAATLDLESAAFSKAWLRLLHYRDIASPARQSRVVSPAFFLAPQGKSDPLAELQATIAAFKNPQQKVGRFELAPQCAFPARLRFLRDAGLWQEEKEAPCGAFAQWREGLNASSATLIYSTAYANNPASMFGHTFLRLNASPGGDASQQPLLAYGVGFAAEVPYESDFMGIRYVVKGLGGGYRGIFSVAPYYLKVNEYNNAESRDLWEYELNFKQGHIDRLVEHLWENYTTAYHNYYFLHENCSYHLLALLEVANHDLTLTPAYDLVTPPLATIRQLVAAGVIREVNFRPSNKREFEQRLASLSSLEKRLFYRIIKDNQASPARAQPRVLDTTLSYMSYLKFHQQGETTQAQQELLLSSLHLRAKLAATDDFKFDPTPIHNRPDWGHPLSSMALSWRQAAQRSGLGVSFRAGYHDLLAADEGFEPYSEIKLFDLEASLQTHPSGTQLLFENLTLMSITSLYPFSFYEPQPSWRFYVGAGDDPLIPCGDCRGGYMGGDGGLSLQLNPRHLLYGLLGSKVAMASQTSERLLRVALTSQLAYLGHLTKALKVHLYYQVSRPLPLAASPSWQGMHWWTGEAAWSLSKDYELRASVVRPLQDGAAFKSGAASRYTWSLRTYF